MPTARIVTSGWDFLRTWHREMRTADGRLIPLVPAIGNHEVKGGFGKGRAEAPFFYALFDGLFTEHGYATLDVGEDLSFIMLDSGHTTDVAGEQTRWLDRVLRERADRLHVLPTYHVSAHPSLPNERAGPRRDIVREIRKHWIPLFERHGIATVFEHDDHVYKRTHPLRSGEAVGDGEGGIVYIGDGAWGRDARLVQADRPYLAVAAARLYVLRVELMPDGSRHFVAYDERGDKIDELRQSGDTEPRGDVEE